VVCRNLAERAMEVQQQQKPNGGTEKKGTSQKLSKRGNIFSPFFFSFWNLSIEVKESFDLYLEKLDSKMEM
jgi:hypothetical protein